jgi:hypothetical protein
MSISGIVIIAIAFVIGLFYSKRSSKQNAQVLDLTAKIKAKQDEAAAQQKDADKKVSDYEDALKKYNSSSGDGSGQPPAKS